MWRDNIKLTVLAFQEGYRLRLLQLEQRGADY